MSGQIEEKRTFREFAEAIIDYGKTVSLIDKSVLSCFCNCKEYPEDAYKEGEDLMTSDFAFACRLCGRVILPEEFSEPIEEHDYAIKNT